MPSKLEIDITTLPSSLIVEGLNVTKEPSG